MKDAVIVPCVSLRRQTSGQQHHQCYVPSKRLADITHTYRTNNPMSLILGHPPQIEKQHDWHTAYDFGATRPPGLPLVAARFPAK